MFGYKIHLGPSHFPCKQGSNAVGCQRTHHSSGRFHRLVLRTKSFRSCRLLGGPPLNSIVRLLVYSPRIIPFACSLHTRQIPVSSSHSPAQHSLTSSSSSARIVVSTLQIVPITRSPLRLSTSASRRSIYTF